MRGRRGLFSLFTSLPEHPEEQETEEGQFQHRRRRRHSSGERDTWSHKIEYFFASLGYAVGLGNIWRFPYLCYRNGGGAFLIPYFLALLAVGFPMMFMEMSFGQFASLGTITIWRICPIFKGIGYAVIMVLLLVNTYYNVLNTYALFYLFASITDSLPWATCGNEWNTPNCIVERRGNTSLSDPNMTAEVNGTTMIPIRNIDLRTPTEEYFENHLLKMTTGIDILGEVRWPLIVCLGVSWFTCFMCLFKGIKSMGKAVIFTTIFSYLILTVLLVRGVTLPGSLDGIIFYLKPDWGKLAHLQVWGEASAQAFASLTLGGGGWITLSSYNKFRNRCDRDAFVIGIGNALTSLYAGFVIFSMLGYMAYIKGTDIENVTGGGPSLAFVAYPEAVALLPGAPFWSICFFFMMFTVGLDSLFGQVETIAAGIIDEWPDYLRPRRKLFTLFLCTFMFLLGIPLTTEGGMYWVTIMDWYTLLFSFSIISFFEVVVLTYIYGYNRFAEDIEIMLGKRPNRYFQVAWMGITPIVLLCVMVFLSANYVPAKYSNYEFPQWAESIGWLMALGPCLLIPIVALIQFLRKVESPRRCISIHSDQELRSELFTRLFRPEYDWGPAMPDIRRKYSYGAKQGVGDDDVFMPVGGGAELTAINPLENANGEKDRMVKFEDEAPDAQTPLTEDVEKGAEVETTLGEDEKPTLGEDEKPAVQHEESAVKA